MAVDGLLGDLLGLVGDVGGAVAGAASPLLGPGGLDVRVRFARAFIGRGLKEEEAERYDQAVEQGRILVVAECRGRARE